MYNLNLILELSSDKMNGGINSNSKENKPEVSIQSLKDIVKKFKNQGFQSLTHHDLAVALSTVGFAEVSKQFGAVWNIKCQKQALKILASSDYDLAWYGKTNSLRFVNLLTLCSRGDIEKVKQLIATVSGDSKKELFNTVDNFKRNALHLAVKEGYDVLAEYLINEGCPLNARDRELKTPLHYCRNELICQVLINKRAKVVVRDNRMCTPAHCIAGGADYKCLQILLKAANLVNEKDATGKTALFYAVFNTSQQQVNIIRVLLENGAKVNEQDLLGRTPLHYAAEIGKSRCIPILLRKGAAVDARDKHGKSPLDLAQGQDKVRKIMLAYCNNKGVIFEEEEETKRKELKLIEEANEVNVSQNQSLIDERTSKPKHGSKMKESKVNTKTQQTQIFSKEINQVSSWVRQKFFVLMKKLQQSGVKAMWHLRRPYIYTGSWAEDVDSLEDLYQTFLNVNGPEAAMRAFNILCPYQKPLPSVIGKSEEAFQSFFGESWFSTDPIQKLKNIHSSAKMRNALEQKAKENQSLQAEVMGYRSEIEGLESKIMNLNQQISHYKKVEEELRREKTKNTQQYAQMLKLMSENEELKAELNSLMSDEEKTKVLAHLVEQLKQKNSGLVKEMEKMKIVQAAARRKCGQVFIKSLGLAQNDSWTVPSQQNLYDDDAIISLYNLLKGNPPNLEKRFQIADRRGNNKLTIDEFTNMLEELSMLPQDVMSMHRITGFAFGRKTLSLEQFKTILQNRHKNRPMWEKKLVRKLKAIILESGLKIESFFKLLDKNSNGSIEASELRKGLESYNIFMNQQDWSNLFNLLDSDNSGEIDLNELITLMEQERTGKLQDLNQEAGPGQQKRGKQNDGIQPQKEDQNERKQEEESKQEKNEEEQEKEREQEHSSQQFQQPYQEKDSDEEEGTVKLTGKIKIQIRNLKILSNGLEKVYIKLHVNEDVQFNEPIKMADLTKKKLEIIEEMKLVQYKVDLNNFNLNVSVWSSREMAESDYLGEIYVDFRTIIEKPNEWAINGNFELTAEQFEKEVEGKLYLQARWSPETEQS